MRALAKNLLAIGVAFKGVAGLSEGQTVLDKDLQAAFDTGKLAGLHSVYVEHQGEVLADVHFRGKDERWGQPLGIVAHGPETLHDLRSVTKSVVGLLYGIALAEGKVPPLDAPLIAQFPEYADLAADPLRAKIKVRDALAMTMGTAWNEDLPYTNPANSEIAMEMAPDRFRYVLDRPMVSEPGRQWVYNGGAVAIVARLIADGTGMAIDDYARRVLFAPLGIDRFEWIKGADGVPSAASGLRLTAPGLARIGRLIVGGGAYQGVRIVPAAWLAASFQPHSDAGDGLRYGYLWWLAPWGDPPAWVAGFGNGGQRLTVQAQHDLIIVIFAGRYNRPDAWKIPVKVIDGYVVPAVRKRLAK